MAFKITVISPNATYTTTSDITPIDGGSQLLINIDTTGVQNGQPIPYSLAGDGLTPDMFEGIPSLTGTVTINDGEGTIVLVPTATLNTNVTPSLTVTIAGGDSTNIDITSMVVVAATGFRDVLAVSNWSANSGTRTNYNDNTITALNITTPSNASIASLWNGAGYTRNPMNGDDVMSFILPTPTQLTKLRIRATNNITSDDPFYVTFLKTNGSYFSVNMVTGYMSSTLATVGSLAGSDAGDGAGATINAISKTVNSGSSATYDVTWDISEGGTYSAFIIQGNGGYTQGQPTTIDVVWADLA